MEVLSLETKREAKGWREGRAREQVGEMERQREEEKRKVYALVDRGCFMGFSLSTWSVFASDMSTMALYLDVS